MLVPLLFFLSGAAALVLQAVFLRQMTWLAGSAVAATSLVLAAFMAGLALGAFVFGPRSDRVARPLRLYGLLELGVAAASAALVLALSHGREILLAPARALHGGTAGDVATFALAFALLLVPTLLMGGTLPALARHVVRDPGGIAGALGLLYGLNTLGAAVGALLGGLVLFEFLGVSAAGLVAATGAACAGLAAIALDRSKAEPPAAPRGVRNERTRAWGTRARRACLVATALGGAAVLGYEVVWTRLLALCLRSYAYSFSVMLGLFLIGLVIGSLAVWRFASRVREPILVLVALELGMGAWVASSLFWMPAWLSPPEEAGSFGGFLAAAALRAVPIVVPPTILSGMALPLAARVFATSGERVGREVGAVYAANTVGAIAGALVAGLVLLPALGAPRALAVLAGINALAGVLLVFAVPVRAAARAAACGIAVAVAAAVGAPRDAFLEGFLRASRGREAIGEVLAYREGATDTVAVVRKSYGFRDPDAKSVIVNGIAMTATVKPVWRYMAAEGHLPALLAPHPDRALVVCVGTGITLGALLSHDGVAAVDAVDLSEGVLASLPLFDAENGRAYADPRVRLVRADGRHFLETTARTYGLVTLEPPPPIVAGSAQLYSLDFYRACRRRLEPGGVVAQWLPLHAQSLASARMAARTFLDAFPHVQLWLPSIRDAVLIGSDRPIELPLERLRAAYASPRTRANLEAAYLETPEALLGTYLLDRAGIEAWCGDADRVTDERPRMEFFRRLGPNMKDPDIATLLEPAAGDYRWVRGLDADPELAARVAAERYALERYVRSEVEEDLEAAREAARASRGTGFFLYRFGCDPRQIETLRKSDRGGGAWASHARNCALLTPSSSARAASAAPGAPDAAGP
ncbi:MAG TPA: fused MFS/spermidine synthase [Candidatus Polarisedimenticolaceae bacterium]